MSTAGTTSSDGVKSPGGSLPTHPPMPTPARQRPRSRLWWAALATGSLALLLIGAWLGHRLWPREVIEMPAMPRSSPSVTAQAGVMPDVVGLKETFARRAVVDAGVTATVTSSTRPAAGPPGVVVDQSPAPGGPVSSAVTLSISAPASVLPIVGTSAADARAKLEALGALVTTNRVVQPGATPGSVVAVRPAVGRPLPATVDLDVADQGDSLPLGEVDSLASTQCSTDTDVHVGSAIFTNAFVCRNQDAGNPPLLEYDLAARTQALSMMVGLDNAGLSGPARVLVTGDGKPLWRGALSFGKSVRVIVPTRGVIRLRISVISAADNAPTVVLGEAVLLGDNGQMDGLR